MEIEIETYNEDEVGLLSKCPTCEKQHPAHHTSRRTYKHWILAGLMHTIFFLFTTITFILITSKHLPSKPHQSSSPADHDAHLVGTFACEKTCLLSRI